MSLNFRLQQTIDKRIDNIITQLYSAQRNQPSQETPYIQLTESDIFFLCNTVRETLLSEPSLLELEPPLKIFGDIHGQFLDLLHWFNCTGTPKDTPFLFLGDYVDRGKQSIETICLLFAYKIKNPKTIHLLRGNHESAGINKVYGFYDECKRRYNIRIWKAFTDCFTCLPIAAVIDFKIFCCHGGLSPHLNTIDQIKQIKRPCEIPESGLLCDLLWSDPEGDGFRGWGPNDRGISYVFGADVVHKFLSMNDLDLICRGHQVVEDGYEFFADQSLVTIFSAPNYCGEFKNNGAILSVNEQLICSFMTFKATAAKSYRCFTRNSNNLINRSSRETHPLWQTPHRDDDMDIDL